MIRAACIFFAVGLCARIVAQTEKTASETKPLKIGVFVDTYYAASLYRPASRDRQFLTQVARDREFNINLAHLDATVDTDRLRGRLALQFGTSVTANYQYESTGEKYSNQFSVRNLQEAFAGYRLFDKIWLDAGIFFGHIGFESWISHDNWNYTRALQAENTPYYSTGARLSYEPSKALILQLLVLNGWQTITSTNRDKSFGTQIAYELNAKFKIIFNTFAGNVATDESYSRNRFYGNLVMQYLATDSWQFALMGDAGMQKDSADNGYRHWYTAAIYARYLISPHFAAATRLEYFIDADQAMISTATPHGFQVAGATFNFDYMPETAYRLRVEYRNFFSKDGIYQVSAGIRPQEHIITVGASLKL